MGALPSSHYASLSEVESSYFWHICRLRWVDWLIRRNWPTPSRLKVLDYGCGTGGLLDALDQRFGFAESLGVDGFAEAIKHASRRGPRYRVVDPYTYVPNVDVDLILMMDVVEHVERDEDLLRRLTSSLRPGAGLIISAPAGPRFYSRWDHLLGHHRRYTRRAMADMAARAGLDILFLSHAFSFLVPGVLLRRRASPPAELFDELAMFPPVPASVNRALIAIGDLERAIASVVSIPFGTSLIMLAVKR